MASRRRQSSSPNTRPELKAGHKLNLEVRTDVDLSTLCTFKLGGTAREVFLPSSLEELARAVTSSHESSGRSLLLGRGSNVVFSSREMVTPLIVTTELNKITLAGVPGTVGGALAMNAEGVMDILEGNLWIAELAGKQYDEIRIRPGTDFRYSYRHSSVQDTIAVAALLRLSPKPPEAMEAAIEEITAKRRRTQPHQQPSAGSVFKNPPNDFAGRLLEAAGMKGARVGDAAFSDKHANFIVNLGNATGEDVLELMLQGKKAVWEKFGISLFPEVKFFGEFDPQKLHYLNEELSLIND
ncbi:MAG: hypothetical protein B1H03_05145 [Planctomycetales bacterium 4484_113]|nr:MAG: hypothetical protein B1H03_05145 [Planctomycetales bacterium 4484_113]